MKKLFWLGLLYPLLLNGCATLSTGNGQLSIGDIEREVLSIENGQNIDDGADLEEEYNIKWHKDGKWNCQDRAEVARQIATENGYKSIYQRNKVHMWLCIYDDQGEKHEILNGESNYRKQLSKFIDNSQYHT